ncbi:MAG: phage holin family protein [Clostridium sp.]|jgi:hypothetical protein|nr:phage holin family protein [Clostridium sp.]
MIDLTPIAKALLGLVAALITVFIIPWLKRKASAEQLAQIKTWVEIAVTAAEQLYKGSGCGSKKKRYVLDFLQSKGFTIDTDSLDKLIEAAVFNLPQYLTAAGIADETEQPAEP